MSCENSESKLFKYHLGERDSHGGRGAGTALGNEFYREDYGTTLSTGLI